MQETQKMQAPSLGREDSPGGGNGYPLQYSCLENPMDRPLVGYSPSGCKELDRTEATVHMCTHIHIHTHMHTCGFGLGCILMLDFNLANGLLSCPLFIFSYNLSMKMPYRLKFHQSVWGQVALICEMSWIGRRGT